MKRLWLVLFVSFLALPACGSKSDSKSPISQVDSDKKQNEKSLSKGWSLWEGIGTIQIGFETSRFRPEGMDELWWIHFQSDTIAFIYFDEAGKPFGDKYKFYKALKFNIIGFISPKGSYGHLGSYKREIIIQGISEITK